jgi:hypothetical protein
MCEFGRVGSKTEGAIVERTGRTRRSKAAHDAGVACCFLSSAMLLHSVSICCWNICLACCTSIRRSSSSSSFSPMMRHAASCRRVIDANWASTCGRRARPIDEAFSWEVRRTNSSDKEATRTGTGTQKMDKQ